MVVTELPSHRGTDPESMDNALKSALLSILRPLVRYLIGRGWSYPVMSEMLKEVYVSEAESHYAHANEGVTDSRISLLTGIHRKDVKRLRQELRKPSYNKPALRRESGLAARVIATWVSTSRYLDAHRRPRSLPLSATGNRPSFESLVRETRADMRPNVILDELLRVGVVEVLEGDKVKLLRSAYVSDLPRDKVAYLGDNLGDHLESALYNIRATGPPFIERAVYYELIEPAALEELRPELFRMSEQFLETVNRKVMPLNAQALKQRAQPGRRMRLGVFYYESDTRADGRSVTRGSSKPKRTSKQ
ncbi:MAG: DUF6502 family protein [Acidiferrobacterales bacterium]